MTYSAVLKSEKIKKSQNITNGTAAWEFSVDERFIHQWWFEKSFLENVSKIKCVLKAELPPPHRSDLENILEK